MSFDYDVVLHFWQNSLSPGTEQIQYWGCTGAVPHRLNYPGLCDEEIEAQAIALSNARTYDELREAAQALDRMVISQNLFIPLFYSPVDRIAVHEAIQLPEISSLYGPVLETWWREQGNTQE